MVRPSYVLSNGVRILDTIGGGKEIEGRRPYFAEAT